MAPRRRQLVAWSLAALLAPGALAPVAATAVESYDEVVEIVFPTDPAVASFQDDFNQARGGGRAHMATDIVVPKHTPVYAAAAGVVCYLTGVDEPEPSWGHHLRLCGDDGVRYDYVHLNNDTPGTDDGLGGPEHAYASGIAKGTRVEAGQLVAWAGDSGNAEATVSHLHFEMAADGVTNPYGTDKMNPYPSLVDAYEAGRFADGAAVADTQRRLAGTDRVGTALAVATDGFDKPATVVVVRSDVPWPALVAGPLAAVHDGPVLTTPPDRLDRRVHDQLAAWGTTTVLVVGSLGFDLAAELDDLDIGVAAFDGPDRYATSARVAEAVWQHTAAAQPGGSAGADRAALVALGEHEVPARSWPDALMASYHGSSRRIPVLLTPPNAAPEAVVAAIRTTHELWVVGGPGAISDQLVRRLVGSSGTQWDRLAGTTRYGTALAVVDDLLARGLVDPGAVWTATGHNWPDATAAGPVIARAGDVLLLANGSGGGGDDDTMAWLFARADVVADITAVGGPAAISASVLEQLAAAAAGTSSNPEGG